MLGSNRNWPKTVEQNSYTMMNTISETICAWIINGVRIVNGIGIVDGIRIVDGMRIVNGIRIIDGIRIVNGISKRPQNSNMQSASVHA